MADNAADPLPLFKFGAGADPLVVVAGGLIFDTGEAERTFLYRCQDRFLSYTSILGWQTVFLAMDEAHVSRYLTLIDDLRDRFDRINAAAGIFGSRTIKEPLFVCLDIDQMTLRPSARLIQRLQDPSVMAAIGAGVAFNQMSPLNADFVARFAELLAAHGVHPDWSPDRARAAAEIALTFQDKAFFSGFSDDILRGSTCHVPTALISETDFAGLTNWPDFAAAFHDATGATLDGAAFVKTNRNTSGNVSAKVTEANFENDFRALQAQLATERSCSSDAISAMARAVAQEVADNPALRDAGITMDQLRAMMREQAQKRHNLTLLIQPDLSGAIAGAGPAGFGISYVLDGHQNTRFAVNAQLYRDPARTHFVGGYLCPTMAAEIGDAVLRDCDAIADAAAQTGYRGPFNIDLLRDKRGALRFVNDCNPRLTGIFPTLAVQRALDGSHKNAPVLSNGYRGECRLPDLEGTLARLDAAGHLLTPERDRGVVLLPNLSSDAGYDLHLVGYSLPDALALFQPGSTVMGACGATAYPPVM